MTISARKAHGRKRRARIARAAAALPLAAGLALAYAPGTGAAAPLRDRAPACDETTTAADAYRQGHTEGLADGRADGYADAYKQSYDDVFATKQGANPTVCPESALKSYTDGYTKAYDTGFAEGKKKGAKQGKKEGEEDLKKGTSRNVRVLGIRVDTDFDPFQETDCSDGVGFKATLVGSDRGTVKYHWEGTTKSGPLTVEFTDVLQSKELPLHTATIPSPDTRRASGVVVIDSGPSKGKRGDVVSVLTCKK
ncbi:hypothetical protein AB0F11_12550 [Streptomyces sp. NPDC032472]|uniref:hypothetical protein n=1 Tax=Streptomyces sp. NPDC032472 TaxID=3155018 RepID=UPI0033EAA8BA